MIKRLTWPLVAALTLLSTACSQHTIIPDDELAQIFHDAFLTNAYIERQRVDIDSLNLYAPIFARYGYTTEDVQYTIGNFSKRKSARLSDVVEAAIDLLEAEEKFYNREVAALDTIKQVALRSARRTVYEQDRIRVRSLRDTAKLAISIDVEPGSYEVQYDYLVDSLDENTRLQRRIWVENSEGEKEQMQYFQLRRHVEDHASRTMTIDTAARKLHLKLLAFIEKPKRPSITVTNLRISHTPPAEEAIDQLYERQLKVRIFADQFLRAAIEKDSL